MYIAQYTFSGFSGGPLVGADGKSRPGWNVTEWIDFVNTVQKIALQNGNSSIPIIYGLDSVHGKQALHLYHNPHVRALHANMPKTVGANYVYGATIFPHNNGAAAAWNPNLVYHAAKITAKDTRYAISLAQH